MTFRSWGQQYQFLCAYLENTKMYMLFLLFHFKDRSLLSVFVNLAWKTSEEPRTYLRTCDSFHSR